MSLTIHTGDALQTLRALPSESVQCVITSPPYYGLRDYNSEKQIGLEPTVQEYIANLVNVFRECRRVLKKDGTLWLIIGDSYCSSDKWGGTSGNKNTTSAAGGFIAAKRVKNTATMQRSNQANDFTGAPNRRPQQGIKPKDLFMVPHRMAIAMQDDGWHIRQDIVWEKANAMPESVRDRPTRSHEYIFLCARSRNYYYNAAAIREEAKWFQENGRGSGVGWHRGGIKNIERERRAGMPVKLDKAQLCTRNKRSVWTVPTAPYLEAHFATFPPKLIEPCILAGTRPGDTVLDPFFGAGTTALVAIQHGRSAIGIELNPDYVAMAHHRINAALGLLASAATAIDSSAPSV
ncbi:MAG: site-specific DNA-methyltransferase [Candidatus Hydrogenedentes bacterium]|nr:site-specific DNA-methyltransferase [Candidatus Hydrogenedentota bacterium]